MIKIENVDVFGWDAAIRGMRNPMNSWDKSDSGWGCTRKTWSKSNPEVTTRCQDCDYIKGDKCLPCTPDKFIIGENDLKLMKTLSKAGSDHGKFLRMINVTLDITAPLYWWKEFDTYKVGTVANSCSTMHKIHAKEFTLDDFSCEHLRNGNLNWLLATIQILNEEREYFLESKEKSFWWQMIQLLPSSYNQKRTVQLNYQVLKTMYLARKQHKLDEWREFCEWCESLPYFKEICIQEE